MWQRVNSLTGSMNIVTTLVILSSFALTDWGMQKTSIKLFFIILMRLNLLQMAILTNHLNTIILEMTFMLVLNSLGMLLIWIDLFIITNMP